jgi:hypothetical protein
MGGGSGVRVVSGAGVEVGTAGTGVEVGATGGVAHATKSSPTKADPIICSNSLLRFITSSLKLDVGLAAASVRAGHPNLKESLCGRQVSSLYTEIHRRSIRTRNSSIAQKCGKPLSSKRQSGLPGLVEAGTV